MNKGKVEYSDATIKLSTFVFLSELLRKNEEFLPSLQREGRLSVVREIGSCQILIPIADGWSIS